jgi:RNA polymerase-binding transcription factor
MSSTAPKAAGTRATVETVPPRKPATKPAGAPPTKKAPAARNAKPKQPAAAAPTSGRPGAAALPVRQGEDRWSPEELRDVETELRADDARLRAEIAAADRKLADLLRDSSAAAGDDQADTGSKNFEREHELSIANNTRDMLVQTERALARIAAGTYGVCESCGEAIGKARLQVFPRATLCVSCKQRQERR